MTTKLEQAARQALEALESCNVGNWSMAFDEFAVVEAITALREALDHFRDATKKVVEQAKQEPVTIDWEHLQNFWRNNSSIDWGELESAVKCAVAAPVRTVDLTDDEIAAIVREAARGSAINRDGSTSHRIARAVIAADREKNK